MMMLSGADEDDEVPALAPYCPKHRPRFLWQGHYVDSLKFLTVQDMVPLSLNFSQSRAISIIRDCLQAQPLSGREPRHDVDENVALTIFEHWLRKRRAKNHFLSQHHIVALQDMVAYLPGEWEQNKHKSPFYVKPSLAGPSCKRKRLGARLSAPRKSNGSQHGLR